MAKQQSLLTELKQYFRLNIYEAKIWTALLSRGIASAGELADISGVPRSRCYDVLESLEKKGFIIMKIGKPIKYIGVKPEVILERVKKDIKREADTQVDSLLSISETDAFKELELLHKSGVKRVDISDISKSIVGRSAINKHIKDMLKNSSSKVIIVNNQFGLERNVKAIKSALPLLRKNGVEATLYAPYDKKVAKKVSDLDYVDFNSESSFISVDGKEMLFMVSATGMVPEYEVAIWIDSPFFVSAMNVLFEQSVTKK